MPLHDKVKREAAVRFVSIRATFVVVCGLSAAGLAHADEKVHDAEYAVRWMPTSGGPATTEEVLSTLGLSPKEDSEYDVRYFEVETVPGFPEGYDAIARERADQDVAKTMYKMRGYEKFPDYKDDDKWEGCPLKGKARDIEAKHEVDISWVAPMPDSDDKEPHPSAGKEPGLKRVYSVSCSINASQRDALPEELSSTQVGCVPHVVRFEDGKVKVERWVLSNGKTLFEVSKTGKDLLEELNRFHDKVVKPLLDKGIVPMGESKTIVASSC